MVVIGAGNTAMDCLRVAKRLGAPTVRCVYRRSEAEAPARIEELRHAKEEGIEFFFLHAPVEILVDDDGNVRGMKVQKMMLGEPDEKGRRKPVPLDEFVELECDTVIYALGTKANPIVTKSTPGLESEQVGLHRRRPGDTQATSVPGVFAGGDIVTGGATVILAMGAGRRAARAIGAYLASGKSKWPITQDDADAFVPPTPIGACRRTPAYQRGNVMSICPRCQRPLDDDEPYICCAGVELRWRCTSCHKVSEGFAFPLRHVPALQGQARDAGTRGDRRRRGDGGDPQGLRDRTRRPRLLPARVAATPRTRRCANCSPASPRWNRSTWRRCPSATTPSCRRRRRTSRSTAPRSSPASIASPRTRPTCSASPSPSSSGRWTSSPARARRAPDGSVERELYRELAAEEREHVELLTTEFRRWETGKAGIL